MTKPNEDIVDLLARYMPSNPTAVITISWPKVMAAIREIEHNRFQLANCISHRYLNQSVGWAVPK